jgi:hypothetical protein
LRNTLYKTTALVSLVLLLSTGVSFAGINSNVPAADTAAGAQPNNSKLSFNFGADLVSRYVWRGVEFGTAWDNSSTPHFQPNAALGYDLGTGGALTLGFWGSYGFSGNYSENDIFLTYAINTKAGGFGITFTDYYYPYLDIPFSDFKKDGKGAHTFDAEFTYTLPEAFPLSLMVSNNIYNDAPGQKSLYIEANYPFTIQNVQMGLFVGAAKGPSVWHSISTDHFEFCNVGFKASKSVKITQDFSLPLGVYWIYNAHLKDTHLIFKVSF